MGCIRYRRTGPAYSFEFDIAQAAFRALFSKRVPAAFPTARRF